MSSFSNSLVTIHDGQTDSFVTCRASSSASANYTSHDSLLVDYNATSAVSTNQEHLPHPTSIYL